MISRRHILSRIGLGSLAALLTSRAQRSRAQGAHEGHAMPEVPVPAQPQAVPGSGAWQAASSPAAGSTNITPQDFRRAMFSLTAGWDHIPGFMAGATSTGQATERKVVETRSSAMPPANFPIMLAVAGATR